MPTSDRLPPLARATVPVRTCDIGGWTDTWFGGPGRVLNIAVSPGVEVTVAAGPRSPDTPGERMIQAALGEYWAGDALDVHVASSVPSGCALGTSSAVAVALVGALMALRGDDPSPAPVARAAHRLESEVMGEECGVQDHLASAFGGISYIRVERYPDATVEPQPAWEELGDLLSTVYLGQPHVSSAVHREVIAAGDKSVLGRLRAAAAAAREAVQDRDPDAFGFCMKANTQALRDLHPSLVGRAADAVIDLARSSGAVGWKVNGAGGDGGSVAVLHDSARARRAFHAAVGAAGRWRVLPLSPCQVGLDVTLGPS